MNVFFYRYFKSKFFYISLKEEEKKESCKECQNAISECISVKSPNKPFDTTVGASNMLI